MGNWNRKQSNYSTARHYTYLYYSFTLLKLHHKRKNVIKWKMRPYCYVSGVEQEGKIWKEKIWKKYKEISENYTPLGSASPALGCNILENRPPKDVLSSKTGPVPRGALNWKTGPSPLNISKKIEPCYHDNALSAEIFDVTWGAAPEQYLVTMHSKRVDSSSSSIGVSAGHR